MTNLTPTQRTQLIASLALISAVAGGLEEE